MASTTVENLKMANIANLSPEGGSRGLPPPDELQIIKRDGSIEVLSFDKILKRVKSLGTETKPNLNVNYSQLVMKIVEQLYNNMPTYVIDELTAEQCASLITKHIDYGTLASRIIVSNNHKTTTANFAEAMDQLYQFRDVHGEHKPLINKDTWQISQANKDFFQDILDYTRDYLFDYFGFKTLERAYLMKIGKKIIERPQHMWLRVAIGIHGADLSRVKETYDLLSQKYFTHATPTLFNAGTNHPQLSSCYLLGMSDDSIDGIYNTLKDCAKISKWAGGIGLHVHNIRAAGTHINGTNGISNGLVPMLRVFNMTARYVDQGGGKRNGSFAIYLEPWHADIEDFLDMKKNHGDEEMRARDLFYALWLPDLFMEKVKNDEDWSLFCPHKCPGLADCYGADFKALYEKYCQEGKANKTIKARTLWFKILDSQMETGTPYLLYKDASNQKSNQQNLGVIKSSNLCTEVILYSDHEQTAVCNLASIGLAKFVKPEDKSFDYAKLHDVVKVITFNLNRVIDINYYPTEKTRLSNLLHRPIGIGVQGLADVFALMNLSFTCDESKTINKLIFETIYHASLESSMEIARDRHNSMQLFAQYQQKLFKNVDVANLQLYSKLETASREYTVEAESDELVKEHLPIPAELFNLAGTQMGAYSSFPGSPASKGILQFDMWPGHQHVQPENRYNCKAYDWTKLKAEIVTYGLRNSVLVSPMPTASTSQILGSNECFEPFTSNLYSRRTNAGEFVLPNKYLMAELLELGLWNETVKDNIILNKGSVQQLNGISPHLKEKYKTVWEMPMKHLIDMAADRGPYICQSQSLNLWLEDPDYKTLTSMHFYSWQAGLKTGIYYLRRKAKHQAQQFTIAPPQQQQTPQSPKTPQSPREDIGCEMCSS
jgi:ribonucleoside-diphosphate reductase alpha chain